MYKTKDKIYGYIGIIYYLILLISFGIMGKLYKAGWNNYRIIYWILFIVAIIIVLAKDKNFTNLGFSNVNLKVNLLIMWGIILLTFALSIFISDLSLAKLFKGTVYYLFEIAVVEEIIFRGFLQNYLFGFNLNKKWVYIIGGICFSLMHLPFQMYVHNMESATYIIFALPQLLFTFFFHLIMCFITYKRKDVTIPIALHYAINFLQNVL